MRPLKAHVQQFKPDCLYIYHEPYAVATFQMLRAAKSVSDAPVGVRSAQNLLKRYPTPFRQMEHHVYSNSDFAVVVSDNVADVMRQKGYKPPISVVPMPVDRDAFFPGPEVVGGPLRVGFVGRLVPEKGVDTALRAIAALPRRSATLTVVGAGPEEANLRGLAARLGLEDAVHFTGWLDRGATAESYRHLDVVVVPSKETPIWQEQFGRVIIEAAASSVPSIVTRSGELPFLLADIGAGWVIDEDDHAIMAEILNRLCQNRTEAREAGQIARATVIRRFSDESVVHGLVETFEAAASTR